MNTKKKIKIQRWGNSNAVRLPHEILDSMGLSSDDEIVISLEGDSIVISKPPPSLKELVDSVGDQKFNEEDTGEMIGREEIND